MNSFIFKMAMLVIGLLSILVPQHGNAQGKIKERSFEYHLVPSTPVNHLYTGKILGVTNLEAEDRIVSVQILKGALPQGIAMFDDGTLAIKQDKELTPGKYKVKAEFVDIHGNSFTKKIKFVLAKPVDYKDIEASIRIAKPKFTSPKLTNHYKAGDIIAQFNDPTGTITEAQLIKGTLPPGVMFVQNKSFVVTQPDQLKDGEYFCLFFLKDEKGGNSVLAVSLPIGLQVGELHKQEKYNVAQEN